MGNLCRRHNLPTNCAGEKKGGVIIEIKDWPPMLLQRSGFSNNIDVKAVTVKTEKVSEFGRLAITMLMISNNVQKTGLQSFVSGHKKHHSVVNSAQMDANSPTYVAANPATDSESPDAAVLKSASNERVAVTETVIRNRLKRPATSSSNNTSSSKRTKTTPKIANDHSYDHGAQLPLCTSGKCMYQTDTELASVGPNCMRDKHFKKVAENVGMTYMSKQDPKSLPFYNRWTERLKCTLDACPHLFNFKPEVSGDDPSPFHPAYLCAWGCSMFVPEEHVKKEVKDSWSSLKSFANVINYLGGELFKPSTREHEDVMLELFGAGIFVDGVDVHVYDLLCPDVANSLRVIPFLSDISSRNIRQTLVMCHIGSTWFVNAPDCGCKQQNDAQTVQDNCSSGVKAADEVLAADDTNSVELDFPEESDALPRLAMKEACAYDNNNHDAFYKDQYESFVNAVGSELIDVCSVHHVNSRKCFAKGYVTGVSFWNRPVSEAFSVITTKCDIPIIFRTALHAFCVAESLLPDPAQSSAATLTAVLDHAKSDPLAEFNGTPLLEAFREMLVEGNVKCRADFPDPVTADSNLTVEPYAGLVALFNQWLDKVSNGTSFSHLKTGFVVLLAAWHYRIHGMFMICKPTRINQLRKYTNTSADEESPKFVLILEIQTKNQLDFMTGYTLAPDTCFKNN